MERGCSLLSFHLPQVYEKPPRHTKGIGGKSPENGLEIGIDAHFQAFEWQHLIADPGGAGCSSSTFSGEEDGIVLGAKAGI